MKFVLLASMAAMASAKNVIDLDDASVPVMVRFGAFIEQFDKTYETEADKKYAYAAFLENDAKIQDYNSQGLTYTLGHNEFSDMKSEDFNAQYLGGYVAKAESEKNYDMSLLDADRVAANADSLDWVAKGAVTPIKNQGQCGSCWAFSTVMGIEGDLFVEQNTLISLSEQDLVSCDHNGDQGCNGGLMDNAFTYVATAGIATEESYPYTSGGGSSGTCNTSPARVVKISSHKDVPQDETALLTAVNQQPVSVAIEADKSVFQLYKSGVLTSQSCGTNLDHGVGIVGYGTLDGTDYWKVKNSWGTSWGMEGYILLERNVNMCGIKQSASYPTGATHGGSGPSPSVAPSPSVSPSPAPPGGTHYEDPNTTGSCMSDEVDVQVTGIDGSFCSPKCTGIFKTNCPTDVPTGTTAKPACALQDSSSGEKYCALECTPSGNDECPTNASCKQVQGASIGLCTYDK